MVTVLAWGGTPVTPHIAMAMMVFGAVLAILALRGRPIRKIHGIGNKLRAFSTNYFQGPEQLGAQFMVGIGFVVLGIIALLIDR